jgi:hypothetical protein
MLVGTADDSPSLPGDEGIVQEAVERWLATEQWQGKQDQYAREDIKFANADARNQWMWPEAILEARGEEMPSLTINNTRVHNDIVINAMSKNGFGAKVRPTGGKASFKSAQMMQRLIQRIQDISQGSAQRRKVVEQQVDGGIGYMLLETAYVSNRTRDQDIYLRASRDPTGVRLDPWIRKPNGLDANFGFVFDRSSRKEFNRKYPKWKDKVGFSSLLKDLPAGWISDNEIMLCKYFRKKETPDTFVWYEIDNGDDQEPTAFEGLASEIKDDAGLEIYKALIQDIRLENIVGGTRRVFNDEVEWFLIAGDTIIDRGDWAGKYIPILRAVGREVVIDNTLDRKGHTRPQIDANRMLNYNASMAVQSVANQTNTPWLAAARAVEGQEQWKDANIKKYAVLLYNDIDDEASPEMQEVKPPQRIEPPAPSAAYSEGMKDAERQQMIITGQFQAQMGENDTQSAASGKAIGERKEQGDTATYHFAEHMSDMDCALGIQLLDLMPKIYDTRRALHITGDDGEKFWIRIDPNQTDVMQELKYEKEDEEAIRLAFNPQLGEYECVSDPGPSSATRRQEAWQAMSMIMQANKEIAMSCADLLFKYGDFEGADQLAERLQKEIKATKPYLFDDNLDPQLAAVTEQNKRLTALNGDLMTKLADEKLKVRGRDEKRDIEAYGKETDRMKAIIEYMVEVHLTPAQKSQMEHELSLKAHDHVFSVIEAANAANIDASNQGGPNAS